MLYLLKSYGPNPADVIYKVGFTDNLDYRLAQYKSSNPHIKLLDSKEGSQPEEQILHRYLHTICPKTIMSEWYYFKSDEEAINGFKTDLEGISNHLWLNRETAISPSDTGIYQELFNKYSSLTELLDSSLKIDIIMKKSIINSDNIIKELETKNINIDSLSDNYRDFLGEYYRKTFFVDRMKLCCDYLADNPVTDISSMPGIDICFKKYLKELPITRIRSLKYQQTNLDQELKALRSGGDIQRFILNDFRVGDRITLANLKEYFKNLYFNLGITTKTPKASDIEEWFVVKKVQITDKVTKKINNGYELLNLK